MDIIGHAVYGATFCSRWGLAGGKKGFPGGRVLKDWTVWLALFFWRRKQDARTSQHPDHESPEG